MAFGLDVHDVWKRHGSGTGNDARKRGGNSVPSLSAERHMTHTHDMHLVTPGFHIVVAPKGQWPGKIGGVLEPPERQVGGLLESACAA